MANNRSGVFLGGLILGAAVGAIAGVLAAPCSGRESRRILRKSAAALPELAEDLSSSMQVQADRLSESALQNWDSTLTRLKEAIAAGLEASQRESQYLSEAEANLAATKPMPKPPKSAPHQVR